jgi:hypothetical protein
MRWIVGLALRLGITLVGAYLLYIGIKVVNGGYDALLDAGVTDSSVTYWIAAPAAILVVGIVMLVANVLDRFGSRS